MSEMTNSVFENLFRLNVNEHTEKKSNGQTSLTYLSWAWAWAEVKKQHEDCRYEIMRFGADGLPYQYDPKTGYMVWTAVIIEGIRHEMWLPVMDGANKAMKAEPYTYQSKVWNKQTGRMETVEKTVQPATMFDINKTIMRCLTKNLAMFGLGLYIYAGEDLPEDVKDDEGETTSVEEPKPRRQDIEILKSLIHDGIYDESKLLAYYKVDSIEALTEEQAKQLVATGLKRRNAKQTL